MFSPPQTLRPAMPSSTRRRTPDFIPSTYSELFSHYYSYVSALVWQAGIDSQNVDDVTMSILTKFFENDVLSDFDSNYITCYGGVTRKAVFRTFLSGFVKVYVRHYRERQNTQLVREPLYCDDTVVDGPTGDACSTWIEVHGQPYEDTHEDLYTADLINSTREHLKGLEPESSGKCQLHELFDAAIEHVHLFGKPDVSELATQFGVSETTLRTRLLKLKDEVRLVFAS